MNRIKLHVDRAYQNAAVDPRIFSSFIEHMGRCVYEGIYEPNHPAADAQGFRKDVLALIQPLNLSCIRYPGGNFLSGFDWKDSIGPRENRPRRLDLAWRCVESNQFGMDEFVDWAKKAGTRMMGAVNLGTGSPKDAAEIVEYCNFPGGTAWSDQRIANGHKAPHDIKLWCLGNEMSGPWQICHMSPEDYAKKARETAKMMKWVDPSIELVVCGSAGSDLPSYPAWDRIVLEDTYDAVDYLSLHKYCRIGRMKNRELLACFLDVDRFFRQVIAVCDYVKAVKRSKKNIHLSFDEWNIAGPGEAGQTTWPTAPHIAERTYTLLQAIAFAGMGMTILNHADRVKIACQAQLVNVLGAVQTQRGGRAIAETIYYPFLLLSKYGRGINMHTVVDAPLHETELGDAPQVYTSTIWKEEENQVTVFAVNIDEEAPAILETDLQGFGPLRLVKHIVFAGAPDAANTFELPDAVLPCEVPVQANIDLILPKLSFHVLQYKAAD